MKIDILGNYITGEQKFFKGKLIRATSAIVDDSHVVDEIYNELNKGVFM